MANINQDYNGQTKLKDWWKIIKSNLNLVNDQTEKHISGEADRHKAEDIDYNGRIAGPTTVKDAVEQIQANIDSHKAATTLDHPDGSVTEEKLAAGAVTDVKIGNRTINKPDAEGTTSGLLTALLNTITAAIKSHIGNQDNPHNVTKAQVGLGNVDNTSDKDKPVSTAQQAALDAKANKETGSGGFAGGHNAMVLGGGAAVGNGASTSDGFAGGKGAVTAVAQYEQTYSIDAIQLGTGWNQEEKTLQIYDHQLLDAQGHIPDARMPQLENKVDKVEGKGLSTNDYTDEEKEKLASIDPDATSYVHPTGDGWLHIPATGTTNAGKVLTAGTTPGAVSWQTVPGGGGEGGANIYFAPETEAPAMAVGDVWYIVREGTMPAVFANAGYDNLIVAAEEPAAGENWGQVLSAETETTSETAVTTSKTINFINGKLTVGETPEADTTFFGDTTSQ